MALTMQAVEALTYIEQVYYECGEIPTAEKIAEVTRINVVTIKAYWEDPDFRKAVLARGIVANATTDTQALTYPQLMFANMMMNPSDKRSVREKVKDPSLEGFGITVQQANGWMRSGFFQDHLRKRALALFGGAEASAYKGFVSAVESGDMNAIKMFFEMKNIYNPRVQVDFNISSVVVRIIEIVSNHVKDPGTLQAIANDIDGLELGVLTTGATESVAPTTSREAIPVSSKTQFTI